jgi:hypothetical protein
MFLCLFEVILA